MFSNSKTADIKPRSKRDEVMFQILKFGMEGQPSVDCNNLIPTHSPAIHHLLTWGYIKHAGSGKYSLTSFGLKSLEARYAAYFREVK